MAVENLYATSLSSGSVSTSSNALGSTAGTWTTDTGNVNWTAAFQMGDPSGALITANNCTVTARVRKEATQSGTPTAQIIVRSPTGNTIHTGTATNITSGTGQDLSVTFSQSLIGTNLNDVVVEIVAVSAGGNPSTRTTVQLDYIRWDADVVVTEPKSASESNSLAVSESTAFVFGLFPSASDTGSLAVSESTDIQTFDTTEKSASDTSGLRVYEASEMEPTGGGGGGVPTIDNIVHAEGTAGTVTASLPSGTGDFLVAIVSYDDTLAGTNQANTPTGWTKIRDGFAAVSSVGSAADGRGTLFTAPSSVTDFTFTATDTARDLMVDVIRISGATGIDVAAYNDQGPNLGATTMSIPALTTTVDNCLLLSFIYGDLSLDAGDNATWPGGWTKQTDNTGATSEEFLSTATSSQATAGAITGGTVTLATADAYAIGVIAIAPAGGGPSGTHTESTWDAAAISVSESTDIQVGGEPDPIAGSDTGSIAVSESTDLQQFDFVEKSASDTGSIAVSESSDVTPITPLPGSIEGIEPEASGGRQGPIMDSNGNLYRVVEEFLADGNNPRMMKSSDGGATWAEVDAANAPEGSGAYNDMESAWITRRESHKEIVLAYMKAQSRWWGVSFRTSDHPTNPDTWDTGTFATSSGQDQFGTQASESGVAVVSHSDGKLMAFIRGEPQAGNQAFLFRTKATTSWDTGSTYITDSFDMTRPSAVITDNDTTYLFYRDHTNGRVYFRDISSGGTVFSSVRVDTNGANTGDSYMNNIVPPVYYDDAGTHVCIVGFANGSNQLITVEVRGVSPQTEQTVSTNTLVIDPGTTTNQGPSAALAVHGTTVYAFWCDSADGNVYYSSRPNGGSWSARTLLDDTGTGNTVWWMHANKIVKPNGDIYIGYTYDVGSHADDGGNIKYNELFVASGNTPKAGSESNSLAVSESVTTDVAVSASDTGSIAVSETTSFTNTNDTSDTGSIAVTETVEVLVSFSTTDTGSLATSETAEVAVDVPASDTGSLALTETAVIDTTREASDTGSLAVSESQTVDVTETASDTGSIAVSEAVAVDVTLTGNDTGSIAVSESTEILVVATISVDDTGSLAVSETTSTDSTGTASDSASIAVSETTTSDLSVDVSDTSGLLVTETTDGSNTAVASDTNSLSVSETAEIAVVAEGTDSASIALSETTSTFADNTTTDSGSVAVSESTSGSVTAEASDTSALTITETATPVNDFPGSDTGALLVSESTDIQVSGGNNAEASDSAQIGVSDVSVVDVLVDVTDTASLAISETADVQGQTTNKEASDTGSIAVSEVTTGTADNATTDTGSLAVSESVATDVTDSASDTGSLAVTETTTQVVEIASTDTGALVISETTDVQVVSQIVASDTGAVSVSDIGDVVPLAYNPPVVKAYDGGIWKTATVKVWVNGQWVIASTKVYRDTGTWI